MKQRLQLILNYSVYVAGDETYTQEEVASSNDIPENDNLNIPLYKSSPYYKIFNNIYESVKCNT